MVGQTGTAQSRTVMTPATLYILVDGGSTARISNCLANFIQPPTTTNIRIKGFNGNYSATRIGTVWWPILDEEGVKHVLQIPDTYFVASYPMRLICPYRRARRQCHFKGGLYGPSTVRFSRY
jgi:hypothetical protein